MSTPTHSESCHCILHASIEARRHECYRQLANAILGPSAPREDGALARALAEHAGLLSTQHNITPIRPRRIA
jgi:hypothetical protein